MAFFLLAPENIKIQDHTVFIKHQPVIYSGIFSTLKYQDFEIEMKWNE